MASGDLSVGIVAGSITFSDELGPPNPPLPRRYSEVCKTKNLMSENVQASVYLCQIQSNGSSSKDLKYHYDLSVPKPCRNNFADSDFTAKVHFMGLW